MQKKREIVFIYSITNGVRKMSSQLHHNVKLRINHAGAILKEGEGRTAKISVLAILLVICCWGPGYAIILADIVGISLTSFPDWAFRLVPQACGVSIKSYRKIAVSPFE